MDFLSALRISASGLAAERTRVNVAASNLANAESTRGPNGEAYHRRDPVLTAVPFEKELGASGNPDSSTRPIGVEVTSIVEDPSEGRKVYMPGHPDADPNGFVTFPNVNAVFETVNLISAQRGYEANATAVDTLKSMAQRAMDIAR